MKKILISACLVGDKVRYDGGHNLSPYINELMNYFELVPFCPEVEGGLKIPRLRSEIRYGRVINEKGKEVTKYFKKGAELALNLCKYLHIDLAILKENSPSCGVHYIYNGFFENHLIKGSGLTSTLLKQNGIRVLSQNEIPLLLEELKKENI
ncbi:MAG: DUF523 domain-containing protein [Bacilli bacterium]|jgi:uncharacterized protein YbbK (DUF523 family)|nr:DUF523 domain-containing protein [Bacilli bacterium]NLN80717.1 DUF523 domain-containing protein [Erysipelotrichia bacterium]